MKQALAVASVPPPFLSFTRKVRDRRQCKGTHLRDGACEIHALAANSVVMAGLDPAIHGIVSAINTLLDGRVKPGHDGGGRSNCGS